MQAVIFAAGKSTRTYPLTLTRPKPLLPLLNKPIAMHQLDALVGIVDRAIFIVGYKREMIQAALGTEYRGIEIVYAEQREQLGTGHAVLQAEPHITEPFLAMNGDDLFASEDLAAVARIPNSALVLEVEDPCAYGIYEVRDDDTVVRLVEKPKEVFSNLANAGAYCFTPEIFKVLHHTQPSERSEIEVTSGVQTLADTTGFCVVRAHGHWLPIGYPWHLLDANERLIGDIRESDIRGTVSSAAEVHGALVLGEGSVIRPGVVIEGPVVIGDHCTIGPNAYLRPGTTLGNGCKVGQAVEIKNSILFNNAAVPHLSYVGDSIIGEGSNLGAGTITANFRHDGGNHRAMTRAGLVDTGRHKLGAIISDHVHTGINTSIYPGRKLWPNTTTLPGAVVDRDIEE